MGKISKTFKHGLLAVLLFLLGCSDQDAERIGKISGKAMEKATDLTTTAGERIGLSLPNAPVSVDQMDFSARVVARIKWDRALEGASIKVEADKGNITLTGTLKEEAQRRRAIELAEGTTGVEKVNDSLEIQATGSE